jgi:hypothetical protein
LDAGNGEDLAIFQFSKKEKEGRTGTHHKILE